MRKPERYQPDELDLMLARELELDARQSNRTLGRKLDVSQSTVARRLQKLLDEGVISFATTPYHYLLGFPTPVFIGLKVAPGKTNEVVEYLRSCEVRIQAIYPTTGYYDVLMLKLFSKVQKLTGFLDNDLARVPYLVSTEKMLSLENIKLSWKYLNPDTDRYREPPRRDLDELDRSLIKALESSPRESIIDLGRRLGVDRGIVGRRVKALLADEIIQVVSLTEPSFFGLDVQVFLFVKVQPGKIMSVAESLVTEPRVRHIHIITGQFDLKITANFQGLEEMSDFLISRLGNYPGVISYETSIKIGPGENSFYRY